MNIDSVIILSADTVFADMLVRELSLEGIAASSSVTVDMRRPNIVADLDSGFSRENAILTFSREASRDPDLVRPFAIDNFIDLLCERIGNNKVKTMDTAPNVNSFLSDELAITSDGVRIGDREVSLSATEKKLLSLLASRPGVPFSRDKILSELWKEDTGKNSNICDVYIRYLREKLETPDSARLIITVRGKGYMLRS